MSDNKENKVSVLLEITQNMQSFSETIPFKTPTLQKDLDNEIAANQQNIQFEEEVEKKEQEFLNKDIFAVFEDLQNNQSNIFGEMYINKKENEISYLFTDVHLNGSPITIQIIQRDNNEFDVGNNLFISQYNRTTKEPETIFTNGLEAIKFLFDKKYPNDINPYYQYLGVNTELINKPNEEKVIHPIIKDDTYNFLKKFGIKNKDSFFIPEIGFIYQKDKVWHIIEHNDVKFNINDFDTFIKIFLAAKKLNNIHLYNHPKLEEQMNKAVIQFKQNHENKLIEIEKTQENSKSEDDFDIPPHLFSFAQHKEEIIKVDVDAIYDDSDYDEEQVAFLPYDGYHSMYDEEVDVENIRQYNMELMQNLQEYQNDINNQPVMSEQVIDTYLDDINSQLSAITEENKESQNLYMDHENMMNALYNNETQNIYETNDQLALHMHLEHDKMVSMKGESMWLKLDNLLKKYEYTIEDFFEVAKYRPFQIKPQILQYDKDKKTVFNHKKYIFTSNKDVKISFAIEVNQWYMYANNKGGEGLASLLQNLFKQVNLTVSDKHIETIISFVENHKSMIDDEKNKRIEKRNKMNDVLEHNVKDENMIPCIENTIGLEKFFDNYIKEDTFFLFDVEHKEMKLRGSSNKNEYQIGNKHYRFNNNQWVCVEDKERGIGLFPLLQKIKNHHQSEIDSVVENINKFIPSVMLEDDDYYHIPTLTKEEIQAEKKAIVQNTIPTENQTVSNTNVNHNDTVNINSVVNNNIQQESVASINPINTINPQEITESFDLLVKNKIEQMLLSKQVVDYFSLATFIKLAQSDTNNNKPYHFKATQNPNEILFGNPAKKQIAIGIGNLNTARDFIQHIATLYKLNVDNEYNRANIYLKPFLHDLVAQREKVKLEQHQSQLLEQKIDELKNNNVELKETKSNHQEFDKKEAVIVNNEPVKQETPEEQYNLMLGLDYASQTQALKPKLDDYSIHFNNQKVYAPFNFVFEKYKKMHGSLYANFKLDKPNISTDKINIKIINNDKSHPINSIDVTQSILYSNEEYTIHYSNGESKTGHSLIELCQIIFDKRLSIQKLHQAIAEVKEISFLNLYPMSDLIISLGGMKQKSTNYEYGDLTISISNFANNNQMFKIWQNGTSGIKTIEFAQMLKLYAETGQYPTKELIKSPDNQEICGFAIGKQIVKDCYLNLNNVQKLSFLNTSIQNEVEKQMSDKKKFDLLLPQQLPDSSMMINYLVNKRKINPKFVKELDQYKIYAGEYDVKQTTWYNYINKTHNKPVMYPVVVFASNDSFAAVRGMTEEADFIKQNVPGSNSSEPFYIEPSPDYAYADLEDSDYYHVACFEAAIDGLSYRCLHPKTHIFSLSGTNVNFLIDALIEVDSIMKPDSNIKFIYALDNIDYDENGKVIDKASRLAYFKVIDRMSDYCYDKFISELESIHNINDDLFVSNMIQEINEQKIDEHKKEKMIGFIQQIARDIPENLNEHNKDFRKQLGAFLFNLNFVETGIFQLKLPQDEKYGQFKDWNDYLIHIVTKKQEENPNLSLEEIHENIIKEFNPTIMKIEEKKALKKQMKATM